MTESFLDGFFHGASRIILIVPVIVIIFGLLIKLSSYDNKKTITSLSSVEIKPSIKPVITPALSVQLNLEGPFICTGSAILSKEKKEKTEYEAYIFKKQLYAKLKDKETTQYVLYVNDCVYRWKKSMFTGTKTYGLSSYLNILEMALSFSADQSLHLVKQMIPQGIDMNEVIKTCKKESINDQSVFIVPQSILFKNGEL